MIREVLKMGDERLLRRAEPVERFGTPELAALLGLERVHPQGWKIAASHEHYREALDRAAGRPVRKIAEPYWD